jgi:hypothetical protein
VSVKFEEVELPDGARERINAASLDIVQINVTPNVSPHTLKVLGRIYVVVQT